MARFFPSRTMATLRNKRKLAAVSRETPDSSRGSRGRNVLDPELTQDYIYQVSEEIEGRVTKKLSKELSKTESRILGALSKLDEFLLNPQVRTCSVFQGASKNANSENREIHGNRSSNDPYPEGGIFLTTQDNAIVLRQTWWRKPILTVASVANIRTSLNKVTELLREVIDGISANESYQVPNNEIQVSNRSFEPKSKIRV